MRRFLPLFVLSLILVVPVQAQDDSSEQRPPGYKSPQTARLMGLALPGGGHFYAEEPQTGMLIFGVGFGAPVLGYELTRTSREVECPEEAVSIDECTEDQNFVPLYIGAAVGVAAWALGFADADDAARRANERRGLTTYIVPITNQRLGLAVRMRW